VRADWQGRYLDGVSAVRRAVTVRIARTGLELTQHDGGVTRFWPFTDIRQTQGTYAGEVVRLERGAELTEALLVDDVAFLRALHATSPDATRRFHDPARRRRRVYLTAGAGVGVIALAVSLYLWGMPALAGIAAARVPVAWEASLGDTVVGHLVPAGKRCEDARRQQAVDTIVSALLRGAPGQPYRFRVTVVDDTAVNALAAPGGALVLFRGLLERTASADELAGVLAHEIQHVLHRHGTRMLLQRASTALLLAAVAGDVSGVMAFGLEAARTLGDLQFSRQNEEEADHDGLRMLVAAGIDPRGMLEFFRKVATLESTTGTLPRYLSSHPPSADRLERLKALAAAAPPAPSVLPGYDWDDVKKMCASPPPPGSPSR
jgi:Zn-dependent protease with chaperone function